LAGGFSAPSQLDAEDNTTCASLVTNVNLHVTFTVSADEPFRDPR
jgi:hypothetical protein